MLITANASVRQMQIAIPCNRELNDGHREPDTGLGILRQRFREPRPARHRRIDGKQFPDTQQA